MKLEFLAICNSQYFRGHHNPTFSIMVDGKTTMGQVKEQMKDWQTTDHIDQLKDLCKFNEFLDKVDEFFANDGYGYFVDMDTLVDCGLGNMEDEEYDCYAYFAIDFEESDNG